MQRLGSDSRFGTELVTSKPGVGVIGAVAASLTFVRLLFLDSQKPSFSAGS